MKRKTQQRAHAGTEVVHSGQAMDVPPKPPRRKNVDAVDGMKGRVAQRSSSGVAQAGFLVAGAGTSDAGAALSLGDTALSPNARHHWRGRLFDVVVAGGLLAAALPLIGATAALVLIVDGRPVFYRGERLGLLAKTFTITKFRTLRTGAQREVGGELLNHRHGLKTRCGEFLRETRIDELPQLFHVLRGEMALFGPRPERQEVFEAKCREIPRYVDRFQVKPGLFGYAQILTPHATPKRIRAVIDRRFTDAPPSTGFDLLLLGLTIKSLVGEAAARGVRFVGQVWKQRVVKAYRQKRKLRRIEQHGTSVVPSDASGRPNSFSVIDANDEALLVYGEDIESLQKMDALTLRIPGRRRGRTRIARIRVDRCESRRLNEGAGAVIHFQPSSENSAYIIEQYLLHRSIVELPAFMRRAWSRRSVRTTDLALASE